MVPALIAAVGHALLLFTGGFGSLLVLQAHTHQPDLDRTITHPSLSAEVSVVRDDWGVPHIEAQTESDANFALGYCMAQERLFQMEVLRRLSEGEISEILGPWLTSIDGLIRTFGFRDHAAAVLTNPDAVPPEVLAVAEAFVAGVNYCIENEPLPFEFTVLQMRPRPFTAVDCMCVTAILPVVFGDGLRTDILTTMMKSKFTDDQIATLFPGYDCQKAPATVMESLEEAAAIMEAKHKAKAAAKPAAKNTSPSFESIEPMLADLRRFSNEFGPSLGSNSWVLAPSRSKSGKAILANDPHIPFTNPSVWYEAHIKVGSYDNYGFHLPLVPFPLLGHNRQHAWALTMFANDDVDVFQETFNPDNPEQVMYKGEWVLVQTITEKIPSRFGGLKEFTFRITPHGPVITDLARILMGYDGPDISLYRPMHETSYTDIAGFYKMAHATNLEEFEKGVSLITSPGLNISYADSDGNIAWWAAGHILIRPPHVNHKSILDGASGKDEILGHLPFAQNPQLKNPAWGYIVTANNKSTLKPLGPIQDLQGYWEPDDRAARIEQIIESQDKWSIDEMRAMQNDDFSIAAPPIIAVVKELLTPRASELSPLEQKAFDALLAWDCKHNIESTGACIYEVFCDDAPKRMLKDELGEAFYKHYAGEADHWHYFKTVIEDDSSEFWDDVTTPSVKETRQDILLAGFKDAVATLARFMGDDVTQWAWGKIHTMEFKHPFGYLGPLGRFLNIGPFPSPGGHNVINNMLYMGESCPGRVIAGPSTRRLIDFADPEHSLAILPTGNSGHIVNKHYDDQAPMFMTGQYREPRFTPEQIAAHTEHTMRFLPK